MKNNIRILLCCGAGMSSGFLASSARKAAKRRKLNAVIEARSSSEANEFLNSIDILMLGPHYATEKENFERSASEYGVPVIVVPKDIYSTLDGDKLLDLAISTISENNK